MEIKSAVKALSSMAQETRLRVLKILVQHGKSGAPAGVISKTLKVPHNTLSFHLTHLSNAGLVASKRKGRSVIYYANFKAVQSLVDYIMENCCKEKSCDIPDCAEPIKVRKKKR